MARQRYRKFVADGIKDQAYPWEKLIGQVFLGSDNFVSRMRELLGDKQEIKEIPRSQRYPGRPPLNQLFVNIGADAKQQRNKQVVEAHITYGYTLKEIADCLNIHYTTVSKISIRHKGKLIFQDLTPFCGPGWLKAGFPFAPDLLFFSVAARLISIIDYPGTWPLQPRSSFVRM